MCEQHDHVDRRGFLKGIAAGAGGMLLARAGVAKAVTPGEVLPPDALDTYRRTAHRIDTLDPAGGGPLRVYVLVVDGLRTDEITPILMPNLSALRDTGTSFLSAQCQHVAETLPNHVAMVTGVTGARNGVPANVIYDRAEQVVRDVDRPADIRAETLFQTLGGCGLSTGAVMSKEYLFTVFEGMADHEWHPGPQIPVSDHAPDNFSMDATLEILRDHDPRFMFVNLGDVDRSGHADPSGATLLPAFRTAVLAHTDVQIGRFVETLQTIPGRWGSSVVLVVADHSMDWSLPHRVVNLQAEFDADGDVAGSYVLAQNGGAELVYYTGDPDKREVVLERMRTLALAHEGILSVHAPGDLALGDADRAGDLVVFVRPGWRITDPSLHSNPIPGNHGHPVTVPIPFVITGGAPEVKRSWVGAELARNVDVAPTVAWLFGAPEPATGFEGAVRSEAFAGRPVSSCP